MGIFGNSKMKLFAGSQKVKKAYLGTEKIYSAGSIVTYYVDSNTYYQEEVDSDVTCLSPTTFTPTKSGWIFTGWRENNTASSSVLSSKNMGNEPISLYAVFKKDVTVYTYDDHESSNDGAPYEQYGTVYYNNGNILAAEIEAYECDAMYSTFRGYARFSSYKEAKDNIYPSYTPDVFEEEMMYITEDTYLVALYSETITLTYYNNSTTKSTTTGTKYIEMYNYESEDPKFTLSQASKSGWTARGWSTGTAGNASVSYSSITNREFSSSTTLYGCYKQDITVTFKSYNKTENVSGTYYYNSSGNTTNPSITAPNGADYPGWTWRGWSFAGETHANAGVNFGNGFTWDGGSTHTRYGLYEQTIYLYYNGNGSTSGSVSTQSGTRYYNAYGNTSNPSFTLASNGYSRTGHNFNGWDLGAVGATITLSSSMTAYAQWTAINYYFDINGADNGLVDVYINGSLVASGVSDYYQQHPYGSTYEIKNIRPKSGYNYDGVTGGSLSGTITGATTVTLSFSIAFTSQDFGYTGNVQSFTAPTSGTYQLEVWGAQGGVNNSSDGRGGYSKGNISLSSGQILYICVGGQNGYNGGGSPYVGFGSNGGYGGGATHIAKSNNRGVLKNYASYTSEVLIVAGGGGGAATYGSGYSGGGYGGGSTGGGHNPGTQTSGGSNISKAYSCDEDDHPWHNYTLFVAGSFGQGGNGTDDSECDGGYSGGAGGGGGGWYGGSGNASSNGDYNGGSGGSGYIGGVSSGSMSNGVQTGNGYARITRV